MLGAALLIGISAPASAETGGYIVFDVATGQIFARHNADQAWYPASITKLMTTYVTFQMIKAGRLSFTSPVVMSATAAKQPPSKMGFPVGTVITVDNALKMIMVKSANDVAWALAESVGGSREAFVGLMNDYARQIGMTETVWDNPNGLPDPNQMTTAHDMGLLARALLREFPEYDFYFKLPGIQLGNRVIANHNHLMDHYPGADGMKTGYICASGYNVVASASRNGHRMVAVVLGSHGARPRAELAADLFNHAFDSVGTGNIFSFVSQPETLDTYRPGPEATQPVRDIHAEICGGRRDTGSEESIDDTADSAALPADSHHTGSPSPQAPHAAHAELLSPHFNIGPPVKVWLGGAESLGNRGGAPVQPQVAAPPLKPRTEAPPALNAGAVPAAPRVRAPGAILPLTQPVQKSDTAPVPLAPVAAQPPAISPPSSAPQTPLDRAFTLFQPPAAAPPAADPAPPPPAEVSDVPPPPPPAAKATIVKPPAHKPVHAHAAPKPVKPNPAVKPIAGN